MKYVRKLVNDYCVLDFETTGFSAKYDSVIEIGVLKVRNNEIVDTFNSLINPGFKIDEYISQLTGITNEMLENQPKFIDLKSQISDFIGNDIVLGHNTSFDVAFLQNGLDCTFFNEYMDTLPLSRKLYKDLAHHRLSDMTEYLGLSNNKHRSIADCIATKELYDTIKEKLANDNLNIADLFKKSSSGGKKIDIKNIKPDDVEIDEDNFFYGKHCVFTGKLEKMIRKDAMQLIVNLGGILDNSVIKKTNYLILGNNDYVSSIKDGKSSKQKKAEKLKLEGYDIEIIDEDTFYSLLNVE